MACFLSVLGQEVLAMGFLGGGVGLWIEDVMRRQYGLFTSFVDVEEKTRVNYIIQEEKGLETQINEPGPHIQPEEARQLLERISRHLPHSDFLVLAGSLPPGLEPFFCSQTVAEAKRNNVKTAVNLREEALKSALQAHPYLVMPDTRDLNKFFGYSLKKTKGKLSLLKEIGNFSELCVLRSGFEGLVYHQGKMYELKGPACELKSAIKADDAFLAGIVYSLLQNEEPLQAVKAGLSLSLVTSSSREGKLDLERAWSFVPQIEVIKVG